MFLGMVANSRTILFSVLVSLVFGYTGYFIGVFEAKNRAEKNAELNVLSAANEGNERYDKKKNEIRSLDDADLISRYCASSVFDISYDKCLRTVTYVEQEQANSR